MANLPTRRSFVWLGLVLAAACARVPEPVLAPLPPVAAGTVTASVAAFVLTATAAEPALPAEAPFDEEELSPDLSAEDADLDELPEARTATAGAPGRLYTADLSDETLAERWRTEPEALGPISIGYSDEGRMINALRFPAPEGASWVVVVPRAAWATAETITFVTSAADRVRALHPDAPPLRVNHLSLPEGGWFRPHRSHQSGRDVDLGFYYAGVDVPRCGACERVLDPAMNWDLVKALLAEGEVQVILVDRRVQQVLYDHALSIGEDRAWLDSLFRAGADSIVKHARRHRDHFHVRYFNPRAQELGRRVAPLLAERPDQNLLIYRVREGDNLGKIALRNRSSITTIQKANRMRGTFLRAGQVLRVPMRGPCTKCPVPVPFELPPRRLPPAASPETVAAPPPETTPGEADQTLVRE